MSVKGAPSRYQSLKYANETVFGEFSGSFPTRIEITEPIPGTSFTQELLSAERVTQYQNDPAKSVLAAIGGEFTVNKYLTGAGELGVAAKPATDLYSLLLPVVGLGLSSNVGGVVGAGATTSSVTVTGATIANGSLVRIGVLGDGRGDGQFYRVDDFTADVATLASGCAVAPADGDLVYPALLIYPDDDPCQQFTGQRFELGSPNDQIQAFGCYPSSLSFSGLSASELMAVAIGYTVAHWRRPSSPLTWPDTSPSDEKDAVTTGGGSFVLHLAGSPARVTFEAVQTAIDATFEAVPTEAASGFHPQQRVVGAVRAETNVSKTVTIDAPIAGTNPLWDHWNDRDDLFSLSTFAAVDGRSVGICIPNGFADGAAPVQQDLNGRNRESITVLGRRVSGGSTPLERAPWILAMG